MTASSFYTRRWWALAVLAFAQFVTIMDTSIIGVALPDIQRALGFSQEGLSWVFNAYVVAFGGVLLLGGRLADLLGARRVFSAGVVVLAAGSLVAGLADAAWIEIVGRAVQGLGAALMAPAGLTLLVNLFGGEPRELTKALAIFGAAAPAGGTAGVFLGGVLTEWADWRWTLLVNVPLAVVVLAAVPFVLPSLAARRQRIDAAGALLSTGALALAVFAVVAAPDAGWGSAQTIAGLTGALALLSGFVALQARRAEPLVPLRIFRARNLTTASGTMLLLGAAWIPLWFFLNLYLQQVLGYGAFEAGAALLPMTGLILVLMVGLSSRAIGRFGLRTPLVAGMLVLAVGIGLFGLVRSDGGFVPDVLFASLVAAAGMSLAYVPALNAGLSAVRPEESGLASGLLGMSYQIGSALGLAALTVIAASFGADTVGDATRLTNGFQAAFFAAAGIAVAGALVARAFLRTRTAAPENVAVAEDELAQAA